MSIVLAIPCFNCEKQIVRVIEQLADSSICRKFISEVVIFDNRSTDGTNAAIIRSILQKNTQNWMTCFLNDKNYGLGGTQKLAFLYADKMNYQHLVILHGDDQASVKDLENMLTTGLVQSQSCILGSRFMKGSVLDNYNLIRIVGNRALNLVYSLANFRKISDLGSGLNIFSVDKRIVLNLKYFSDGFSFNMDLLLFLIKRGIPFRYVPIAWSEKDQVSNARNFKVGLLALKSLFRWKLSLIEERNDYRTFNYVKVKAVP